MESVEDFGASADLPPGVELLGTGTVSDRLWARPSVNAIGADITSTTGSSNVIHPEAAAKVSTRIAPGADPATELDVLVRHLETHAPWGAQVSVERGKLSPAFLVSGGGPAEAAVREAMAEAINAEASEVGSGGSIPLLKSLHEARPPPSSRSGARGYGTVAHPRLRRERGSGGDRADDRHPGSSAGQARSSLRAAPARREVESDRLVPLEVGD